MHRALGIPELVELICTQMDRVDSTYPLDEESSAALAALARTSRAFSVPALDCLWWRQDTITNILHCMPADLWDIDLEGHESSDDEETGYERKPSIVALQRPITHSDWDRAQLYIYRVKCFVLDRDFQTPDVFDALGACLPRQCIFPDLQILHWNPHSSVVFHHIRLFLAPCIIDLSIGSIETFSHLSILSTLALKYPQLKRLHIRVRSHKLVGPAVPFISTVVCDFQCLESLQVGGLDGASFTHISRLPNLRRLLMNRPGLFPSFPETKLPDCSWFPALSHLDAHSTESAIAFIATLPHKCRLVEFNLPYQESPGHTTEITQQLYSALQTNCAQSALRCIRVSAGHHGCDYYSTPTAEQISLSAVDIRILAPLLSFPNLTCVYLLHAVGFSLDDAAILRIARAWPRIEVLVLRARSCRDAPSQVTLEGLIALAVNCPSLLTLDLVFDATVVPKIPCDERGRLVRHKALHFLTVAASPVGDVHRVAQFIAALFPRIKWIQTLQAEAAEWDGKGIVERLDAEVKESHAAWKLIERLGKEYQRRRIERE
ncbi:hypothetical protein C8R46DRAFT_468401 [Mycena filopes]|nr:hypothetical protein C8R46DRAFT_468401 [Mycena filopes]